MKARKEYLYALIVTLVLYIASLTYSITLMEFRMGKVEHFLAHQGLDTLECK